MCTCQVSQPGGRFGTRVPRYYFYILISLAKAPAYAGAFVVQEKRMTKEEIDYTKKCIREDVHRFYIWGRWKEVRRKVLEMDRHECQDCRREGRYTRATTVHHCQFLKKHPECALDIWYEFGGRKYRNLVSLCHECHEKRHGHRKNMEKKPLTEERWD